MDKALTNIKHIFQQDYLGNTVLHYLIVALTISIGIVVIKAARKIFRKQLGDHDNVYVKFLVKLDSYFFPVLVLAVIFSAFQSLTVSQKAATFMTHVFTVAFVFLTIRLVTAGVRHAIKSYFDEKDTIGQKAKQIRGIVLIANGILWVVGIIFLIDNLGFDVTAVLTGLGVGGIAIALAAQTILGDLFNYFVIFFDKPFEIGDFIIVDDKLGVVEYIGLKTTRIRSLQGEQVVFSNTNLTNSRIHNYKRMLERRILFKLAVVYSTGADNLEAIPKLIKSIVEKHADTRFDRAHFASYGEYSLNIEVVYYILSADYNQYMDIQQSINLQIYKTFEQHGIEFAFPTYTIARQKQAPVQPNGKPAAKALTQPDTTGNQ